MALNQRRDSSGRTRFLLALTLSTVTALGVAAPLAIQAMRADEVKFAGPSDVQNQTEQSEDDPATEGDDRTLTDAGGDAKGGIGSRPPAKAQAQTSKSEASNSSGTPTTVATQGPALTNNPSTAVVSEDPAGPVAVELTSTTTAEPAETSTTAPTTTVPSTTTVPETTTSSSSTSTTSTTVASTTSSSTTIQP